ncbi:Oidioi.mRNA.OKI2018_I69.chr1.g2203.t1.cds [Oikopleura dioica]|uniref:Oidioi.mRNA.OKI2018_I69.chr1.g2203.t1.cds n=1 Tax=Oikopleura dioica TaxID=34765 RepID=A0ABN7SUM1_OIKDI|nr:Oidioi.mRNA.OKI2018_I69.chr1.g2203.t1.cds [Oikopleura dioica]
MRRAVRGSARISRRCQSVTVNKGWFRPKVQIERVDLERYFIIVEDPSHFVWQNLTDIKDIEERFQIFDQNEVERNIFGDIVSRFPEILEYSLKNLDSHLKFWLEMFQNSSEYSFHLKSYPAACFHLDDGEYLRRRNEMLEFLFSNFGINRKMLIRLILAYPKFFNNEVEEISTKLELLKNLYVSMGGKNFKVFGRTQLAQNVLILEKPEKMADFMDLMTKTGLSSEETLKIISKMAGVLPDLALENVEITMNLLQRELNLEENSGIKKICLEAPTVITLSPGTLSERLKGLRQSGFGPYEILDHPDCLTVTGQILTHRIQKLARLGINPLLENLVGNKDEWEAKADKLNSESGNRPKNARPMSPAVIRPR